jgi:serine/threonine protein kinase
MAPRTLPGRLHRVAFEMASRSEATAPLHRSDHVECRQRMALGPGARLGSYEIGAQIGVGGMGVVYRAWDTKLHRPVAIKLLNVGSGQAAQDPLLAEARAAAALNHPHICTVYEVSEVAERIFIVMEYLAGQSLTEAIRTTGVPIAMTIRYGLKSPTLFPMLMSEESFTATSRVETLSFCQTNE